MLCQSFKAADGTVPNIHFKLTDNLKEKWKRVITQQKKSFFRKHKKGLVKSLHKECYLSISKFYGH